MRQRANPSKNLLEVLNLTNKEAEGEIEHNYELDSTSKELLDTSSNQEENTVIQTDLESDEDIEEGNSNDPESKEEVENEQQDKGAPIGLLSPSPTLSRRVSFVMPSPEIAEETDSNTEYQASNKDEDPSYNKPSMRGIDNALVSWLEPSDLLNPRAILEEPITAQNDPQTIIEEPIREPGEPLMIGTTIDASNILPSGRTRATRSAHNIQAIYKIGISGFFYASLATLTTSTKTPRVHRSTLGPIPRSWKEMLKSTESGLFKLTTDKEFYKLLNKGTFIFRELSEHKGNELLPLI